VLGMHPFGQLYHGICCWDRSIAMEKGKLSRGANTPAVVRGIRLLVYVEGRSERKHEEAATRIDRDRASRPLKITGQYIGGSVVLWGRCSCSGRERRASLGVPR